VLILVSYDIVDDHCRAKVAKVAEDHGLRVQKSVFECELDERDLARLKRRLDALIDHENDSVRFYRLCERCRHGVEVLGSGHLPQEPDGLVII
jgi:CRISPR-associated protein Cas2